METAQRTRRFYHRTSTENARAILAGGFRDGSGTYLTEQEFSGVWLSDVPLDGNEGASGDVLLAVEIAPELVEHYEWIEVGRTFREYLVPSALINQHARVSIASEDA